MALLLDRIEAKQQEAKQESIRREGLINCGSLVYMVWKGDISVSAAKDKVKERFSREDGKNFMSLFADVTFNRLWPQHKQRVLEIEKKMQIGHRLESLAVLIKEESDAKLINAETSQFGDVLATVETERSALAQTGILGSASDSVDQVAARLVDREIVEA